MGKHYHVFSEDHETLGSVILPYRDSINSSNYRAIYEKHGLSELDLNAWYPMQKLLDVLSDIKDGKGGSMMDFVSLGMEMSAQLKLPPESENMSFEDLVNSVEAVYAYNNRGTNPGYIKGKLVGPKKATFEYYTPYPDELLYGSLYGYARRFLPASSFFTVSYDVENPRREQGGPVTIIHVEWE